MLLQQIRALIAMPHKRALLKLQRLARSQVLLLHSNALLESGLAHSLRDFRSCDELVASTGSTRPDYLAAVLELGVALGSLEKRDGRYRIKSEILKAVSSADGAAIACFLRELTHYHSRALRELPAQIEGAAPPDYLADYGDLVAGASRIVEPFLEPFIDSIAGGDAALRILEIGAGSGVYLKRYAQCNPAHHGIAIDYDEKVASAARSNLEARGIAERFEVLHADARTPGPELDGPFDLITSFQNVYYFTDAERLALFRAMRERLAPDGRFVLVSALSSQGFMFRFYDVLLGGTAGCRALPTLDAVLADLHSAGFSRIDRARLLSGPGNAGLIAHR